jgi:hypothetical protein
VKTKEAREFALTAEPIGDKPASKDFMRCTPPKFKTQSQKRVSQSLQRDRDGQNETKLPVSVPPAGLSGTQNGLSQYLQRDTSSIPYRDMGGEELVQRVTRGNGASFGDDARARRIARHYPKSEG